MKTMLQKLKQTLGTRFPRIAIIAALLAPGAYAVYEKVSAADDCCYPGSPCCYPGSPCCVSANHSLAKNHATAQR